MQILCAPSLPRHGIARGTSTGEETSTGASPAKDICYRSNDFLSNEHGNPILAGLADIKLAVRNILRLKHQKQLPNSFSLISEALALTHPSLNQATSVHQGAQVELQARRKVVEA